MELQPEDYGDTYACGNCGRALEAALERAYPYGDELVLCYECSVGRGGVYDELHDHWTSPPDLDGLPQPL